MWHNDFIFTKIRVTPKVTPSGTMLPVQPVETTRGFPDGSHRFRGSGFYHLKPVALVHGQFILLARRRVYSAHLEPGIHPADDHFALAVGVELPPVIGQPSRLVVGALVTGDLRYFIRSE